MKLSVVPPMLALVLLSAPAFSQASAQKPKPNMFSTMSSCSAALESGNFRFYEPKYFGLNSRNPANDVDRIVVPIESNICIEMLVVGGRRFVVQREGTQFRARKNPDGSLSLYARDDCGNPVFGVVFPPPPAPVYQEAPAEVPAYIPPPSPPVRSVPERPMTIDVPVIERTSSSWGVTAGVMIGEFDSVPIGGTIESFTGRVVCLKGRGFDIGAARGGQESSMWRLTIASTAIAEGSYTQYTCDNCTQTVTTTTEAGVRVLGARLERVQGFNNEGWRAIRPMISAHVGGGRISGKAYQRIVRSDTTTAMHEAVDARELLNSSWVPMGGAGVGFMGDIGNNLTYTVVVAGIEYPGVYYGRVSLTYWP